MTMKKRNGEQHHHGEMLHDVNTKDMLTKITQKIAVDRYLHRKKNNQSRKTGGPDRIELDTAPSLLVCENVNSQQQHGRQQISDVVSHQDLFNCARKKGVIKTKRKKDQCVIPILWAVQYNLYIHQSNGQQSKCQKTNKNRSALGNGFPVKRDKGNITEQIQNQYNKDIPV